MKNVSKELSCRFANMSLLCASLVVVIHVLKRDQAPFSVEWWFRMLTEGGFCRFAVPYFFLAAGFFLAGHDISVRSGGYGIEVRKRLATLVIPYFVWCALCFCLCSVLLMVGNPMLHRPLFHGVFDLQRLALSSGLYPFSVPELRQLWFVRVLFVLVLISPFLKWVAKSWVGVALCFVLYLFGKPLANLWCSYNFKEFINFGYLSVEGIAYFTLGMYIRCSGRQVAVTKKASAGLLAVGLTLLCVKSVFDAHMSFYASQVTLLVAIPFLLAGVFFLLPERPMFPALSGYSFPIYVVHLNVVFVYFAALKALERYPLALKVLDPGEGLLGSGVCFIVVLGVSIAFCSIAKRVSRKWPVVDDVLFGGR